MWKCVLAAGLCVVVVYFTLPGVAAKDLTYSVVGISSTFCVWLGVRWHRPAERLGWYLLGAANGCFVFGDGVLDVYDLVLHRSAPFPSVADALYLLGYPFLFAGVFRISRSRGARDSREARADAAIVCIGALALSWQFLMHSYAHDSTVDWFGKLVTMAYPVMDLGVVFIVVSALLGGVARRPADKLIIAAITAMLVGDFVYDVLVLRGSYTVGNPVDAAFLINYVLIATAALHPSMAQPLVAATDDRSAGRRWMPLVAGAGFVSPLILLIGHVAGVAVDVPVLAGSSVALFALIIVRFSWLFGRTRQQTLLLAERGQSLQSALDTQLVLQDDLRHQAFHDSLTGLPNRALLHDRVEHALAALPRSGGIVALCFCDLDGFKAVNDSLGHQAGDELLVVAAKRLASIVRGADTVARLGGDEFAVLFDNIPTPDIATALAERMVSVLRQPTAVADQQTSLTVSIGIAFADTTTTTEQLLSEADTAMYEAKALGKDRFTVFESQMRSQLIDRLAMTNAFRGSLERDEFFLEYQPQISLVDGTLEGFEALVRWRHPTLGHLGPYRFIPLAEDTGFVVELGRWVLQAACTEAATWTSRDGMPLALSVNLSARQLDDPDLTNDVATALASSGLHPEQLILEITESVLMLDPVHTAQILTNLKSAGIRIAIDDFGTGYSSLSYLRLFPVDMLKIDKSFVDPLTDPKSEGAAFVKTILRLARDLHLTTIAEGVEDPTQQRVLTQLQCDSAQGYLISRPLGTHAARAFIHDTPNADLLAGRRPA
ncbi:MAG TPA: EAL domain-containing protein [Acidothermaceae bacterium]